MDPGTAVTSGQAAKGLVDHAWEYGVLGVLALAFATVIIYLFKRYEKREERCEALVAKCGVDMTTITSAHKEAFAKLEFAHEKALVQAELDYEKQLRDARKDHAEAMKAERDANRAREDNVRAEFGDLMEEVNKAAKASSDDIVKVMEKFYDRFVGPRPRY